MQVLHKRCFSTSSGASRGSEDSLCAQSSSYLLRTLNGDCVTTIMTFLNVDELTFVGSVSPELSAVASSDFLWELLLFRDAPPKGLDLLWTAIRDPESNESARRLANLMEDFPVVARTAGLRQLVLPIVHLSPTVSRRGSCDSLSELSDGSTVRLADSIESVAAMRPRSVDELSCSRLTSPQQDPSSDDDRLARVSWRVAYYCTAMELSCPGGALLSLLMMADDQVCTSRTFRRLANESPVHARNLPDHMQHQIWRHVKALVGALPVARSSSVGSADHRSLRAGPASSSRPMVEAQFRLPADDATAMADCLIQRTEAVKETGLWHLRLISNTVLGASSLVSLIPFCTSYLFFRTFSSGDSHAERLINYFRINDTQGKVSILRTAHMSFVANSTVATSTIASMTWEHSIAGAFMAPATPALFILRSMQTKCRIGATCDRLGGVKRFVLNVLEAAINDATGLWCTLLVAPFLAKRLEHTFVQVCVVVVPAITACVSLMAIFKAIRRRFTSWAPSVKQHVYFFLADTGVWLLLLSLAAGTYYNGWTPLSFMRFGGRLCMTCLGATPQLALIDQESRADETALMAHVCSSCFITAIRTFVRCAPHLNSPLMPLDGDESMEEVKKNLQALPTWQKRSSYLQQKESSRVSMVKKYAALVFAEELIVWSGAAAVFVKEGSFIGPLAWKVAMSCAMQVVSHFGLSIS